MGTIPTENLIRIETRIEGETTIGEVDHPTAETGTSPNGTETGTDTNGTSKKNTGAGGTKGETSATSKTPHAKSDKMPTVWRNEPNARGRKLRSKRMLLLVCCSKRAKQ